MPDNITMETIAPGHFDRLSAVVFETLRPFSGPLWDATFKSDILLIILLLHYKHGNSVVFYT